MIQQEFGQAVMAAGCQARKKARQQKNCPRHTHYNVNVLIGKEAAGQRTEVASAANSSER